jgi:hypothetical protein
MIRNEMILKILKSFIRAITVRSMNSSAWFGQAERGSSPRLAVGVDYASVRPSTRS